MGSEARLTASINVAGRANGLNRRERDAAVRRCVEAYRFNIHRLQTMGVLDVWYLHAYPGKTNPLIKMDPKSKAVFAKTLAKALRTDNRTLLPKVVDRTSKGEWKFKDLPPVLRPVPASNHKIIEILNRYAETLPPERRFMLGRYRVVAAAHRVVGIGSVGTRAYLVLATKAGKPFFMDLNFMKVHQPNMPAPEYQGKSMLKSKYGDSLVELDSRIGHIMDKLRELGLDKNTLVIFTTDNGAWQDVYPDAGYTPFRGTKGTVREGGARVPAIAWWPGHIKPYSRNYDIVGSLDFMATFANLAGLDLPKNDREGKPTIFDNYDMTPVLLGTGKSKRNSWFNFTENELTPGAVRVGRFKAVFNLRGDDGASTGGLAVDSDLGWKGAEKYVATVPMDGLLAAQEIRRRGSIAKIVFLTVHDEEDYVTAARRFGNGYVLKSHMASELLNAIDDALRGTFFVSHRNR